MWNFYLRIRNVTHSITTCRICLLSYTRAHYHAVLFVSHVRLHHYLVSSTYSLCAKIKIRLST